MQWYDDNGYHETEIDHATDVRSRLCDDEPFHNPNDLHYGAPYDAAQPVRRSEYTGAAVPYDMAAHILDVFGLTDMRAALEPYMPYKGLLDAVEGFI